MSPATLSVRDGVAVVTMDDGKANAVSLTMQEAVNAALDEAERAGLPVVLTGRTGILSAGFDLKTIAAGGQPAVDMLHGGIELAIRLLSFSTPVVVACNGHAIAMGVFLLLSGDWRIGVRGDWRYTANEVAIGMTMPHSTIEILRNRVTPSALNRSVLLAEVFTPDNGVENGFIDSVVDTPDELLPAAIDFARSTSALDAAAHRHSKMRLRAPVLDAMRTGLALDLEGWKKQFLG